MQQWSRWGLNLIQIALIYTSSILIPLWPSQRVLMYSITLMNAFVQDRRSQSGLSSFVTVSSVMDNSTPGTSIRSETMSTCAELRLRINRIYFCSLPALASVQVIYHVWLRDPIYRRHFSTWQPYNRLICKLECKCTARPKEHRGVNELLISWLFLCLKIVMRRKFQYQTISCLVQKAKDKFHVIIDPPTSTFF